MIGGTTYGAPTIEPVAFASGTAERSDDGKARGGNMTTRLHPARERHLVSRINWLRAALLGGIVSTTCLILGVPAPASTGRGES